MRHSDLNWPRAALIVVDMQRYYLESDSDFWRFHERCLSGSLDYIHTRCRNIVIPNIRLLLADFRRRRLPVIFLRLCGGARDRSDLHPTFHAAHLEAAAAGFPELYPLDEDPLADVSPRLAPEADEAVLGKTTFSAFTSSRFPSELERMGVALLVFTGLATSQCVESTARDAADRRYEVVHVEDAQADYTETTHLASLHSSRGVCGGFVMDTASMLRCLATVS